MIIKINQSYIDWIEKTEAKRTGEGKEFTQMEIQAYVNEILANHRESWACLEEDIEDLK